MSNYYILKFVVGDNDYYAERVTISNPEIEELLLEGVALKDKECRIVLQQQRGTVRNIIENIYGFPVVSQTIADILLEHCANEIELLEVAVARKVNQQYYFVNVLNIVDCINREQSVYELFTPELMVFKKIEKLVLQEEAITNHIFRIKNIRTEIVVSKALKQQLQALNMEELDFLATAAYQENEL